MVLITSATGNVACEVVNQLLAGGTHVSAVSWNPAIAILPSEAQLIRSDPSRPQTLARPLNGIDAILVSPRALACAARDSLRSRRQTAFEERCCCRR
jgi:uncharacterized protein YbjT (DUF2867 family)